LATVGVLGTVTGRDLTFATPWAPNEEKSGMGCALKALNSASASAWVVLGARERRRATLGVLGTVTGRGLTWDIPWPAMAPKSGMGCALNCVAGSSSSTKDELTDWRLATVGVLGTVTGRDLTCVTPLLPSAA